MTQTSGLNQCTQAAAISKQLGNRVEPPDVYKFVLQNVLQRRFVVPVRLLRHQNDRVQDAEGQRRRNPVGLPDARSCAAADALAATAGTHHCPPERTSGTPGSSSSKPPRKRPRRAPRPAAQTMRPYRRLSAPARQSVCGRRGDSLSRQKSRQLPRRARLPPFKAVFCPSSE